MRQRVLNTVAAMVVAMPAVLTVGVGTATADGPTGGGGGGGATFVAFTQMFRRCDFSSKTHIGPTAYGRPTAWLRNTGSELIADVQIATVIPNTPYDVRVIQMPRSSATPCNAGDPGVIAGVLFTNDVGEGSLTLRGPVASGATGAWMFISRPGEFRQTPDEFYTSDFVVSI
jgi:hypothetical protein